MYFEKRLALVFLQTVLLFLSRGEVVGQVLVDPVPVGARPLGVAITFSGDPTRNNFLLYAAVANSGDNSVSVLDLNFRGLPRPEPSRIPITRIGGIPAPYAMVDCLGKFIVTSPTDNSVTLLDPHQNSIVAKIHVGPFPHSAACYFDSGLKAVVSNLGDSSLTILDLESLNTLGLISDVPGSRGLRGITVGRRLVDPIAWVAGTDANGVTLVDLRASRVLATIPVRRPTAVGGTSEVFVASALDNNVTFFNATTLQVLFTLSEIPKALDFVAGLDSFFASPEAGDFVVRILVQNNSVIERTMLPGIPAASGLAAWSGIISALGVPFVLVTSADSNQAFFIRQGPSPPSEFATANGATFGGRIAGGSLATVFANTGVSQNLVTDSLPLRTTVGGVTLRVGGTLTFANSAWVYSGIGAIAAPLLFVGPNQINFQVPPEVPSGDMVPIQLQRPDGSTLLSNMRVTAVAPGIFTLLANGQGPGAVLNQDNSLNFGTNPARRGTVIQIFATGAGATTPPLLAGEPAPAGGNPLVFTQVQPTVTIGGRPARVLFSGMAPGYVGLWQINAEVPMDAAPGPAVPLVITAAGVQSNTVTIAVQ